MLSLITDWFQLFSHTILWCSTQTIIIWFYLTIQNLSREERYKTENNMLLGVIPGPKDNMNSFLTSPVEDLKEFRDGVTTPETCIVWDIPASRKVCGFVSHAAKFGCNECHKQFAKSNYSGYNQDQWEPRNVKCHRELCHELFLEKTLTSSHKAEMGYSLRYVVLLALLYFDPVKHTHAQSVFRNWEACIQSVVRYRNSYTWQAGHYWRSVYWTSTFKFMNRIQWIHS